MCKTPILPFPPPLFSLLPFPPILPSPPLSSQQQLEDAKWEVQRLANTIEGLQRDVSPQCGVYLCVYMCICMCVYTYMCVCAWVPVYVHVRLCIVCVFCMGVCVDMLMCCNAQTEHRLAYLF